jgi:hypothetical protein
MGRRERTELASSAYLTYIVDNKTDSENALVIRGARIAGTEPVSSTRTEWALRHRSERKVIETLRNLRS